MNAAQKALVEKSLGVLGWILVIVLGLILLDGFIDRGTRFVGDMFDADEAAPIVWPLFVAAASLLWARAFMRAGRQ